MKPLSKLIPGINASQDRVRRGSRTTSARLTNPYPKLPGGNAPFTAGLLYGRESGWGLALGTWERVLVFVPNVPHGLTPWNFGFRTHLCRRNARSASWLENA